MKSCFTVLGNITKSLMETTNFLWANCTEKKARGSSLTGWMQGFFFDHSLSNLQRYVADPSSFLVLWSSYLFFFSLVFPSPTFFTSFSFLILFGGGTCVTFAFFSVLLLDGILAEKIVMSHFLRIGWVSFGFTRMSLQGSKEQNGLAANCFLNQYLLCVTIIPTPCFQFLPEEKLLHLSHFVWQGGFLIWDKQILCYSRQH